MTYLQLLLLVFVVVVVVVVVVENKVINLKSSGLSIRNIVLISQFPELIMCNLVLVGSMKWKNCFVLLIKHSIKYSIKLLFQVIAELNLYTCVLEVFLAAENKLYSYIDSALSESRQRLVFCKVAILCSFIFSISMTIVMIFNKTSTCHWWHILLFCFYS